jgi:hypothetical protein
MDQNSPEVKEIGIFKHSIFILGVGFQCTKKN